MCYYGWAVRVTLICSVISNQIEGKKKERAEKADEIDKIQNARRGLEDMGSSQLTVFRDNVKVLQSYWTSMQADAREIEGWLEDGANFAAMPSYMKSALDQAVTVCMFFHCYCVERRLLIPITDASMAQYMDAYAKGTQP